MQKKLLILEQKKFVFKVVFNNKETVKEIINHLGSQSVVLSIDIKKIFIEIIKFGIIKLKNFIKIVI